MQNKKEVKVYSPKKLIEVALPLDDINEACAYEKLPGIGPHPRGIHLWWARRPLAAARAIIFAQMVNDPGYQQGGGFKFGVNKKEAEIKRDKLFEIIRELVKWENTNNEEVLSRAREVIKESWRETCELNKKHPQAAELFDPDKLPAFHDPFAGGGAIPLEAQRLGLESYASDLNPVAVMINKAMIEIPPKFVNQPPVGPIPKGEHHQQPLNGWVGATGLAEDVRRYGHWMHQEAKKRIGNLYPDILITDEIIKERPELEKYRGQQLTVIAWLWARTVKSPNPAFSHVDVPLISNFILSSKKGRESYIEPVVLNDTYEFKVRFGKPPADAKNGTKIGRGGNFKCLLSNSPIPVKMIREQGIEGTFNQRLMAIVVEGKSERVYLSPTKEMEDIAQEAVPKWQPLNEINHNPRDIRTQLYGLTKYAELFTPRQLVALTTFSDLIKDVREKVISDAISEGMRNNKLSLDDGSDEAVAYGDAVATLLTFVIDRCADFNNSLTGWRQGNEKIMYLFSRQAIPMVWDFGEANILANVVGGFITNLEYQVKCLINTYQTSNANGFAQQEDASSSSLSKNKVISTDPPYYDNIGYADLSDFFYTWMRRSLREIYPQLFATIAVPKEEELVATPYRHGSKEKAESFFLEGMTKAMRNMAEQSHPAFPVTIYYAFKQSETKEGSTSSTGWVTFLEAVISAGFSIDGTWPIRSEQSSRIIGLGANALASSVVLVCKKREAKESVISRREFQRELRMHMPEALEAMVGGEVGTAPIAPVDLAQSAIGPGMAIYSKYSSVLNQDGSKMSVHDALIMINKAISDYLNPEGADFDNDTLFCDSWFSQYGFGEGKFGEADTLARAKGTSVEGLVNAGVVESNTGKVRLLKWAEYPTDWNPQKDTNTPIWEACHQLIRTLNQEGESAAGKLLALMPERSEPIRRLAYHLYTLCERKKWADEARAYNELMGSWASIVSESHAVGQVHYGENMDFGF